MTKLPKRKKGYNPLQIDVPGGRVHVVDRKSLDLLLTSGAMPLMAIPIVLEPEPRWPGSIKVKANCCGCEVWLGPQQAALRADGGNPVICVVCLKLSGHEFQFHHLGNSS